MPAASSHWRLPAAALAFITPVGVTGYATHAGYLSVGVAVAITVAIGFLSLLGSILTHVTPQESRDRVTWAKAVLEHRRMMAMIKVESKANARLSAAPTVLRSA